MNKFDRAALERVEKRLAAIEDHQHAQRILLRAIVDLFEDIVDEQAGRARPPAPGVRHLRLVGRDE